MRLGKAILTFAVLIAMTAGLFAGDWPDWRGPGFNGSAADDAKKLPVEISPGNFVKWSVNLPGASAATPIVYKGKIFMPSMGGNKKDLLAMCVDLETGKIDWQKKVGIGRRVPRNNSASCSAVVDDERVYFLYGNGVLVAFNRDGSQVWKRSLEKRYGRFTPKFGYSSSPLLYKGKLFVQLIRAKKAGPVNQTSSMLLALDPKTGKEVYKVYRNTDAKAETQSAYTTPVPTEHKGKPAVLLSGADYVTCHDVENGKELWRYRYVTEKHTNWRLVPSVTIFKNLIITPAPRGKYLIAFDPTTSKEVWRLKKNMPDVCTPLLYKGRLYILDGRKRILTCCDPATGTIFWTHKMPGKGIYYASPTAADGKVYTISTRGEFAVFSTSDRHEVLHEAKFGGRSVSSSIVIVGSKLIIRTDKKLYCFEFPNAAKK